ncbi:MAG: hypothetical protein J0H55_11355 [Chitinophagaceae bacterium]|nr:hypothetical protein [Chitinophagaceae bacterium]
MISPAISGTVNLGSSTLLCGESDISYGLTFWATLTGLTVSFGVYKVLWGYFTSSERNPESFTTVCRETDFVLIANLSLW